MKLTRKQAFELSIRKWEALARCEGIPKDILRMEMDNDCGLCEKYWRTQNKKLQVCAMCPIRQLIKGYTDTTESGCMQRYHPFRVWWYNKTTENAQKVLDLIKSKR